jgi:predicted ATPase
VRQTIHLGTLVVDEQVADPMAQLLPVGETLTLPVRLLGYAAPGDILVTAPVARLVAEWFALQARGRSPQADAPGEVVAYKVLGLQGARAPRVGVEAATRRSFVGRERELAILQDTLARLEGGQGQVVGIVGEPGIGKSRLLEEFRQRLTASQVVYLQGHCLSYSSTIPYLPVLDLLRQSCGIMETDGAAEITAKVDSSLQAVGMDPVAGAPYLLQLLGVPELMDRLDPETLKGRTFDTLRQICLRRSRQQPVVLAIEDLQWSDQTSIDFLASLVEALPGASILLLTTYRPGYRPPWLEKSSVTQLALRSLSPQESLSLVHAVFEMDQVPDPVLQGILAKGQGNPFFLEELARAAVEHSDLRSGPAVPDTIQGVLMARIDRLLAEDKRLLQAASVLGVEVPFTLLQAITSAPAEALGKGLTRLRAAEFLYETRLSPEIAYTFKHALTQQVAYDSLMPGQRRGLHGHIVEAIEALAADPLADQVEQLAHHALQGEAWGKAFTYCRQAGAKAFARSAYREAVAWFEGALSVLPHLPADRDTREQAIDLRFTLRNVLVPLAEHERVREHLRQAESLAEALKDQRRLGLASAYLTEYFRRSGAPERGVACGQRALSLAMALGDFPLQVLANYFLGTAYTDLGDYRRAIACLSQNVAALSGDLLREHFGLPGQLSVLCRARLVASATQLGAFAEGAAWGEEAVRLAESVDQPFSLTMACYALGNLYLHKGDLPTAIPLVERGLHLCRVTENREFLPMIAAGTGYAYALAGRVTEAMSLLKEALDREAGAERSAMQSRRLLFLGEAYLLEDRAGDALPLAERALQLARDFKARGYEAYALWLLGEIHAHQAGPQIETAEAAYRRALSLADELGMRPLLAHCHFGLGVLYGQTGQLEQARAELSAASELYRAMDMTFRLKRAEAELARVT